MRRTVRYGVAAGFYMPEDRFKCEANTLWALNIPPPANVNGPIQPAIVIDGRVVQITGEYKPLPIGANDNSPIKKDEAA